MHLGLCWFRLNSEKTRSQYHMRSWNRFANELTYTDRPELFHFAYYPSLNQRQLDFEPPFGYHHPGSIHYASYGYSEVSKAFSNVHNDLSSMQAELHGCKGSRMHHIDIQYSWNHKFQFSTDYVWKIASLSGENIWRQWNHFVPLKLCEIRSENKS